MSSTLADPSLELARGLRAAIRNRADALEQILAAYDSAAGVEDRWEAAASLMFAIERIDAEYAEAKRTAVRVFGRRTREAGL